MALLGRVGQIIETLNGDKIHRILFEHDYTLKQAFRVFCFCIWSEVVAGIVPSSKNLVVGTLPSSKNLVDGTVPSSKN